MQKSFLYHYFLFDCIIYSYLSFPPIAFPLINNVHFYFPFASLNHEERKAKKLVERKANLRSIRDVCQINRAEVKLSSRKHKWQSSTNVTIFLLICPPIRSRLFPFSVAAAIFQIGFRKHNPSEKEKIKTLEFHQKPARSALLVKSILIIDELSMTEYEISRAHFLLS